MTDVYAALPALTGKFELEYEGELRGADQVALDLVRAAVRQVFDGWFEGVDGSAVVEWFELGGSLQASDTTPAGELLDQVREIQGLRELAGHAGVKPSDPPPALAAAVDFVLEGLYAQKKITRTDERAYRAAEQPRRRARAAEPLLGPNVSPPETGRKKYYN